MDPRQAIIPISDSLPYSLSPSNPRVAFERTDRSASVTITVDAPLHADWDECREWLLLEMEWRFKLVSLQQWHSLKMHCESLRRAYDALTRTMTGEGRADDPVDGQGEIPADWSSACGGPLLPGVGSPPDSTVSRKACRPNKPTQSTIPQGHQVQPKMKKNLLADPLRFPPPAPTIPHPLPLKHAIASSPTSGTSQLAPIARHRVLLPEQAKELKNITDQGNDARLTEGLTVAVEAEEEGKVAPIVKTTQQATDDPYRHVTVAAAQTMARLAMSGEVRDWDVAVNDGAGDWHVVCQGRVNVTLSTTIPPPVSPSADEWQLLPDATTNAGNYGPDCGS